MASKLLAKVINIPKRFEDCGFKNFKTNKDNEKLLELCKNWDGKESMILTGKPGTGKTHLSIAMLRNFPMIKDDNPSRELIRKSKMERILNDGNEEEQKQMKAFLEEEVWRFRTPICLFAPFIELFVELNTAAMEEGGKREILKKYSGGAFRESGTISDGTFSYDCICFDDLGAEKLTEAKRENLYYIIDTRYREILPTIITSNFTINEISDNEPRIASRFAEMGQILQFNGNDYRKTK